MNNSYYFTDPLIGAGLPVLIKNGAIAKQRLIEFINELLLERGYIPLASPHIGNLALFEKSGHYSHYRESMFPLIQTLKTDGSFSQVESEWVLKPMNCPFHIMAYNNLGVVSYKELPIKFYEFGQVYRYEDSGALNGLLRLRSFTQDDGHLFCTLDQIEAVLHECIEMVRKICEVFALKVTAKCSVRGQGNEKYIGHADDWNIAESRMKAACRQHFTEDYQLDVGGAAFYGP